MDGRRQLERSTPSFPSKLLNLDYQHSLGEAGSVPASVLQLTNCEGTCYKFAWYTGLGRIGVWAFWSLNVRSQYHFLKLKEFLTLILHCIFTSYIFQEKLYQATQPFLKTRGFYPVGKPWPDKVLKIKRRMKDVCPWKKMLIYNVLWKCCHLVLDWKRILHDFHSHCQQKQTVKNFNYSRKKHPKQIKS